jgi:type II secretory pathway component PulC
MFRNYFILNIILIVIVSFLGVKFYKTVISKKERPAIVAVKKAETEEDKAVLQEKPVDTESFGVIAEKDIFRPSRTAPLEGADAAAEMPPKNPPTLFGTLIVGSEKTALLKEDAGKTARMYRVNESISGYLIVDIQDDKVLLQAGGQMIEVKLRGKKGAGASQPAVQSPAVQRPQEGAARRRVRPAVQRPARSDTAAKTPSPVPPPAPAPAPAAAPSAVTPVPPPTTAPEPVPTPVPEPMENVEELSEGAQQ